jgi:hypothetical protein
LGIHKQVEHNTIYDFVNQLEFLLISHDIAISRSLVHAQLKKLKCAFVKCIREYLLFTKEFQIVSMNLFVNLVWYKFSGVIEVNESIMLFFFRVIMDDIISVSNHLVSEFWKDLEKMVICTSHCGTIAS